MVKVQTEKPRHKTTSQQRWHLMLQFRVLRTESSFTQRQVNKPTPPLKPQGSADRVRRVLTKSSAGLNFASAQALHVTFVVQENLQPEIR